MKVAVLCEFSGIVRNSFINKGHDAISCDFLPSELPGPHILGDFRNYEWNNYDLVIAHPPCTRLCNSGVRWLHERNLWEELQEATKLFNYALSVNKTVCVENPIPHKYANLPKYSQIIHPWQYGEKYTKATCLWLKNLPLLKPTNIITPTASIHNCSPGPNRWKERSRTFPGIAYAMVEQWS